MTTIHFIYRPSTRPNYPGSISMRITHLRQSRTIALSLRIHDHEWDKEQRTTTNSAIKKKMKEAEKVVERITTFLAQRGEYTAYDIAMRYRNQAQGDSLLDFVMQITKSDSLQDQGRTARAYRTAANRLCLFCKNKHLLISQMTTSLISDFEKHLLDEGLAHNTISFYMRNLRAIYNKAAQMQLIISSFDSPFKNVYTGVEKTRKRALSTTEINQLYNTDVQSNEILAVALQLFFFGFHAKGMSFVDMAYLKKKDVKNGTIRYRRKKTGRMIELKVTKQLYKIIDTLAPMTKGTPYLLPIITDMQKDERQQYESGLRMQNRRLKILARKSELNDTLSTHVCRHSWASLARQIHTPLAVISESLGHSDEKTTQIYLASFDRSVLDKVSEQVSRLVKKPRNSTKDALQNTSY